MAPALLTIVSFLAALVAIAFYTLFERKFLAHAQLRKGPRKVGIIGLPQPFADAIKLFLKQRVTPKNVNFIGFTTAPTIGLGLALILWILYPHSHAGVFVPFGAILFLVISRLIVYVILAAGWASNRKYALLGTMRAIAQTISYEIRMALLIFAALILLRSYNFTTPLYTRISWSLILAPPLFACWFVSILAETNRTPFDFAEGESELVSGFNVEYGGGNFAFIFMAEYIRILVIRTFTSALFASAFNNSLIGQRRLIIISFTFATVFVAVRATLPRIRYDQLMMLTWKSYLPFALFALLLLVPARTLL